MRRCNVPSLSPLPSPHLPLPSFLPSSPSSGHFRSPFHNLPLPLLNLPLPLPYSATPPSLICPSPFLNLPLPLLNLPLPLPYSAAPPSLICPSHSRTNPLCLIMCSLHRPIKLKSTPTQLSPLSKVRGGVWREERTHCLRMQSTCNDYSVKGGVHINTGSLVGTLVYSHWYMHSLRATVEPLYRGHHWDPAGCPVYSGTLYGGYH